MSRKEGPGRKIKDQTKVAKRKIVDCLRPNPAQSLRKIAREINIPATSARNILKRDLELTPRKKDCKQALNSSQKKKRRTRSLKLYRGLAENTYRRVLFSDEKIFHLDQTLNRQNDRVYIRKGQKKPLNSTTVVEKRKFPPKIIVWAGIAHNLKTTLFFIEKGSTTNANSYKDNILTEIVVPVCRKNKLIYQQDGAPCHTAKICSDYLKSENIEFWDKNNWPPNSPDLNPLDYGIWGISKLRSTEKRRVWKC